MTTIISTTGKIHGRGSQPFKWVSGLNKQERIAVRTGTAIVLIADDNTHPNCTKYKQVTYFRGLCGGKYLHKNYYEEVK